MRLNKKYKSNALLVTVIISVVIFMLMSAVVAVVFYHRLNERRSENESIARTDLASAINFVLGDTALANFPQDIFNDTVDVERGAWGICQFAAIRAVSGRSEQKKAFLYGAPLPASMNACLYLVDHGRPLSITGKTRLTGDVYISTAGITAGYIDQRSYERAKLVEGNIKISNAQLPEINLPPVKWQTAITSLVPDSLTQSFFSPAHLVYQKEPIVLGNTQLKGRIVVRSDSAITVSRHCTLDNIILIAPVIRFMKGFSGRVQAFASQEIIAEDECNFFYPSCLVLTQNEQPTGIQLGQDCKLKGMLISMPRTEVNIPGRAAITGVVYSNGYTSLQGKVNGIVLTDFFVYRSPTTQYENYLIDAEINRDGLSQWFICPPVFTPSAQRKIMLWLE